MSGNIAVALPKQLSKKVKKLQKQLRLKTPGEVILKALSLLELSIGRKVELKDDGETLEITSFQGLRQSIKLEQIEEKEEEND